MLSIRNKTHRYRELAGTGINHRPRSGRQVVNAELNIFFASVLLVQVSLASRLIHAEETNPRIGENQHRYLVSFSSLVSSFRKRAPRYQR